MTCFTVVRYGVRYDELYNKLITYTFNTQVSLTVFSNNLVHDKGRYKNLQKIQNYSQNV